MSAGTDLHANGQAGRPAAGIFLHTGWRSCGTWMWERLREHGHIGAFYEPLHESLAQLRETDIGKLRPDSWQSGHSSGAPYFAEFAPLLGPKGGVRDYAPRFAFDNYFCPPEQDDAALESYLRGLIDHAAINARIPVLKFCRSLGRVAWLEAHFADMLHVVVLRDPAAQWRSAQRQMEQNANRYFVVAPFVILARNATNPLLMDAAARLGVALPPSLGRHMRDLSVTTDACWRHVSRLSWTERFRGFLALWIASGLASIKGEAILVDADRLSEAPEMRGAAEMSLARVAGAAVDLMPDDVYAERAKCDHTEDADILGCIHAARAFLTAQGGEVAAHRLAILQGKLMTYAEPPVISPARSAVQPTLSSFLDAAAYVAMMRASYPLRRTHFHVRRWLGDDIH